MEETGIFDFLEKLPEEVLRHPNFRFRTPSEISRDLSPVAKLEVPHFVSWADTERNLSAWLGNPLQNSAFDFLYSLERPVLESKDMDLIHSWRKLQTSDHFYYLCTKWFNDGDVHKYFNPFGSPYDAFVSFTNVLNDLKVRLEDRKLF
jgi:alpha-amylase